MLKKLTLACALLGGSQLALAQAWPENPTVSPPGGASSWASGRPYVELGYTASKLKGEMTVTGVEQALTIDTRLGSVRGIVGYELNQNVAFEAMLSGGTTNKAIKIEGQSSNLKLKMTSGIGLYVKPSFRINDQLQVFGRLGVQRVKLKTELDSASDSYSDHSLSYGIGLSYAINKALSLNLDYMRYYSGDVPSKANIDGLTLGVGYKF